jgi:hypothetical protein
LADDHAGGGRRAAVFGFLSLFDVLAFVFGSSCPAVELGLPYGRLTGCVRTHPDLNGVSTFRTSEMRPGWVPSLPRGPRCSTGWGWCVSRPFAASQRPVPGPHCSFPSAGLHVTRHHRGFTCVHPSGLPLHLWLLDGTAALGLDHLSFAPRRYQRRTSGWGQAIEHRPGLHLRHRRPPIDASTQLVRPRVAPIAVTSGGSSRA